MGKKSSKDIVEIYGIVGKFLCASAGGIVAFIVGGPFMTVPGVFTGALIGHLFEKSVVRIH